MVASVPVWLDAGGVARSQDQQSSQSERSGRQGPGLPPLSAAPPPLDLSNRVLLTVKAEKDRYEQLEPIFLHLEVTNRMDTTVWFDDVKAFDLFQFEIQDLSTHRLVDSTTNFAKFPNPNNGHGPVELQPGKPMRFSVCPNLYVDLTVPATYTITMIMRLKDAPFGRPCIARGNVILVEVVHLVQGRIQRR